MKVIKYLNVIYDIVEKVYDDNVYVDDVIYIYNEGD